jgi:ABC-type multidrug transport system ATPase subunit
MPGFKIGSIRLRDGTEVRPGKLTVMVGPNNAGKTQVLRDLVGALTQQHHPRTIVVENVVAEWPETLEVLKASVKDALKELPDGNTYVKTLGTTLVEAHSNINLGLATNWEPQMKQQLELARAGRESALPAWFGPHFVSFLRTDDRLRLVTRSSTGFEPHERPNLLVALYYERRAERQLDDFFHKAFGLRVKLDYSKLGQISLRVGDNFDDVPAELRDGVAQLDLRSPIDSQGDGMRSFVGTALGLLVGARPVVLIDEPEAFLHPPQAVQIGEMIAELAVAERQVIVATHSADVLRGMLNRGGEFDVVRLTRKGNETRATKASAADIKTFASNPVLATARVIEGLFYQAAVVVEADSDSAFYHRVARQVCPQDDVLYTRAHNKQTIQKLVAPYRKLGVRAAAVADLDLLRRRDEFEPLLASATGDSLDDALRLQEELRASVETRPVLEQVRELQEALAKMLREWAEPPEAEAPGFLSHVRRELKSLREAASHWDQAKRRGVDGLPAEAKPLFAQLTGWCAARGVFIIPVGQLEGWLVSHGVEPKNDKSKWIVEALIKLGELEVTANKEQQEPWAFIKKVHDYLLRT